MVEKRLTAMQVVRCATPGLYADGGGLYLQVTIGTDGSPRKSWLFHFSLHGRARHMGLGPFSQVSLAEARAARDKARAKVRAGIDPIEARHITVARPMTMTFDQAAAHYIRAHETTWRARADGGVGCVCGVNAPLTRGPRGRQRAPLRCWRGLTRPLLA